MIYGEFQSVVVLEKNKKQNLDKYYTIKYQKHVASSYVYKLVCLGGKFSKSFKFYLDENAVYNFINNIMEESKYYTDIVKN